MPPAPTELVPNPRFSYSSAIEPAAVASPPSEVARFTVSTPAAAICSAIVNETSATLSSPASTTASFSELPLSSGTSTSSSTTVVFAAAGVLGIKLKIHVPLTDSDLLGVTGTNSDPAPVGNISAGYLLADV